MFLFAGAIAAQDASKQEHPSSGASPSKVAQMLGTAAEYKVSQAVDRNAGMVLKVSKERLKGLAAVK